MADTSSKNSETITLIDNRTGKKYEFPIMKGTMGPDVIDIRKLYGMTGMFTFDPGFTSTASCESAITYIDGDAGILLHRGYRIEELARNSTFLEVAQLLINGELPTSDEHKKFTTSISRHSMIHEQMINFYRGFRRDAHPMATMIGCFGAMSAFYHDSTDFNDPYQRMVSIHRMISKMPTMASYAYKYSIGQPFMYPQNNLSYVGNFLRLTFGVPCEEYQVNPAVERAMDRIFILHADHEQNASTSTVRLSGSSGANPFACISAGISSLWGPSHGGANEAVLKMLADIKHKDNIPTFLARVKDKNDTAKLMGFGHRVYKNYDPRAGVLKESCDEVLKTLGVDDPMLELAMELEQIALKDEYFVSRKLFPNVDFYSGIILRAIGFPTSMFTVLFALARTAGWLAQWNEMIADKEMKIGRPRQLFTGHTERPYLPIYKRK